MTVKQYQATQAEQAITLTERALKHVKTQIRKRGSGIGLRLAVEKRGCSGLAYVPSYVDESHPDDHIFPLSPELNLFVDPLSYTVLKGTRVDYVRDGLNEHFVYTNPNQSGSCGCGESFTV